MNKIHKIKKFSDLFYEDILITKLTNLSNNLHNIILVGSCGSGKTSIINLIKKKYNNHLHLSNFNYRGHEIITNTIYNYIKIKTETKKLIIIDDYNYISQKAQLIINNLIDNENIYFIIACYNPIKIMENIQSNCIIINLILEIEIVKEGLENFCLKKKIDYDKGSIKHIINLYDCDLRKIMIMVDIINLHYKKITINNINKLYDKIDKDKINEILEILNKNDIKKSIQLLYELLDKGFSKNDILESLTTEIMNYDKLDEEARIEISNIINKKYIIINETVNSKLQIYACFGEICNYISNQKLENSNKKIGNK
tara:strand:+ start:1988 stop:2926 length:939 start_codon:yes stop_codon:yes gene_type:complete